MTQATEDYLFPSFETLPLCVADILLCFSPRARDKKLVQTSVLLFAFLNLAHSCAPNVGLALFRSCKLHDPQHVDTQSSDPVLQLHLERSERLSRLLLKSLASLHLNFMGLLVVANVLLACKACTLETRVAVSSVASTILLILGSFVTSLTSSANCAPDTASSDWSVVTSAVMVVTCCARRLRRSSTFAMLRYHVNVVWLWSIFLSQCGVRTSCEHVLWTRCGTLTNG